MSRRLPSRLALCACLARIWQIRCWSLPTSYASHTEALELGTVLAVGTYETGAGYHGQHIVCASH